MGVRAIVLCVLGTLVATLSAQTQVFEKMLGTRVLRVARSDQGPFAVSVISGTGATQPVLLPEDIDLIADADLWNNSRIMITAARKPLISLCVVDANTGVVLDNLFANLKIAKSPDNRRWAFDAGRSLVQSQTAMILLYDLSRPPRENRMADSTPAWEGYNGGGIVVYPDWNRAHNSSDINAPGAGSHDIKSPLVWISTDTLVFFDYSSAVLTAVLIQASDITQPSIRTHIIDVEPLITGRGKTDFRDKPLASLPVIADIIPISVGPTLSRIRVTLQPNSWLTTNEFELEF